MTCARNNLVSLPLAIPISSDMSYPPSFLSLYLPPGDGPGRGFFPLPRPRPRPLPRATGTVVVRPPRAAGDDLATGTVVTAEEGGLRIAMIVLVAPSTSSFHRDPSRSEKGFTSRATWHFTIRAHVLSQTGVSTERHTHRQ